MPLTHVCVWEPKIGYRRITIEEASVMYPYEVSARSGHFKCELCRQNIGFSKARIDTGTRYFFHSSAAQDKSCEDRQAQLAKEDKQQIKSLNCHTMPIRLSIDGSAFSIQLGFFYFPNADDHCSKIRIANEAHQLYEYSSERIERIGITYLNVGTVPSRNYWIEYINADDELKKYWPNKVQGINPSGTFFDCESGRMLYSESKADPSKQYYLLLRNRLYCNSYGDVEATEISRVQISPIQTWYLYKIRIKKFSKSAAEFFFKYSIFLVEKPTKFYPIWPLYIKDPYFIYHNSEKFYFYLCGDDAELRSYPATVSLQGTQDGKLYKLYTREREQLVSLGKFGTLNFTYLVKQSLKREVPFPTVKISDQSGNVLTEEVYTKLPRFKLISISCQYDGKAVVRKDNQIEHIYKISSDQELIIDELTFGTEIYIYQGCDIIRSICFEKSKVNVNISELDNAFVKRLMACSGVMIPTPHAIGTLMDKYGTYPETKQWIYTTMRQGQISRKAFQLLKSNILCQHEEG